MRPSRNAVVLLFGFTLPILLAAPGSPAVENTIWQIGTFDQSSHEFNNNAPVGKADYNPVFTVGKSVTSDWPRRQPGSKNQAEGLRPHPAGRAFGGRWRGASRPPVFPAGAPHSTLAAFPPSDPAKLRRLNRRLLEGAEVPLRNEPKPEPAPHDCVKGPTACHFSGTPKTLFSRRS